jgi:hypothetical protein
MSKKKSTKPAAEKKIENKEKDTRMLLVRQLEKVKATVTAQAEKVGKWGEEQSDLAAALDSLAAQVGNVFVLAEELEASGFLPPKTTPSRSVAEGDDVTIIPSKHEKYVDLVSDAEILDHTFSVAKKRNGRGGLVLVDDDGNRVNVSSSDVAKVSGSDE